MVSLINIASIRELLVKILKDLQLPYINALEGCCREMQHFVDICWKELCNSRYNTTGHFYDSWKECYSIHSVAHSRRYACLRNTSNSSELKLKVLPNYDKTEADIVSLVVYRADYQCIRGLHVMSKDTLMSYTNSGTVSFWEVLASSQKNVATRSSFREISSMPLCAPTGINKVIDVTWRIIGVASLNSEVTLWHFIPASPPKLEKIKTLHLHSKNVSALAKFDEYSIISGGDDRKVCLWRWRSDGRGSNEGIITREHRDSITAVCVLEPGKRFASADYFGEIRMWSVSCQGSWDLTLTKIIRHNKPFLSLHILSDSNIAAYTLNSFTVCTQSKSVNSAKWTPELHTELDLTSDINSDQFMLVEHGSSSRVDWLFGKVCVEFSFGGTSGVFFNKSDQILLATNDTHVPLPTGLTTDCYFRAMCPLYRNHYIVGDSKGRLYIISPNNESSASLEFKICGTAQLPRSIGPISTIECLSNGNVVIGSDIGFVCFLTFPLDFSLEPLD